LDPVYLRRIHYADFPPHEYLQRPPETRAHPESLDIVVAATSRQHTHGSARSSAGRRHVVNRPISTDGHYRHPLGQPPHDAARVAGALRHVPDRP
jgi:homoserine acetyltransferase